MMRDPEDPGFILLETPEERRAAWCVGLLREPYQVVTRLGIYNAPCLGATGVWKQCVRVPRDIELIKEMLEMMGEDKACS